LTIQRMGWLRRVIRCGFCCFGSARRSMPLAGKPCRLRGTIATRGSPLEGRLPVGGRSEPDECLCARGAELPSGALQGVEIGFLASGAPCVSEGTRPRKSGTILYRNRKAPVRRENRESESGGFGFTSVRGRSDGVIEKLCARRATCGPVPQRHRLLSTTSGFR
jgi:hypothetical protein